MKPKVIKPNILEERLGPYYYETRTFRAIAYLAHKGTSARSAEISRAVGLNPSAAHVWLEPALQRRLIKRIARGQYILHPDIVDFVGS